MQPAPGWGQDGTLAVPVTRDLFGMVGELRTLLIIMMLRLSMTAVAMPAAASSCAGPSRAGHADVVRAFDFFNAVHPKRDSSTDSKL